MTSAVLVREGAEHRTVDLPGDGESTHERKLREITGDPLRAGVAVPALAVLLCVGFVPQLGLASWSPRLAILSAVLLPGLVVLVRLVRSRDRAAIVGLAFLAWVAVGGLLSSDPRTALLGQYGNDASLLILAASLGLWAVGRTAPSRAAYATQLALGGALAVQAMAAILQVVTQSTSVDAGLLFGRARGLTSNPVYLGALMAAGASAAAVVACRARRRGCVLTTAGAIVLFTAVVELTGSRIALAALILVVGVVAVLHRWLRGAAIVALVILGLAAGKGLIAVSADDATSSSSRAAGDSLNSDGRFDVWGMGIDAAMDDPLFGSGAGRFRAAIQDEYTSEFLRAHPSSQGVDAWGDAHNVAIQTAATTGVVGAALLLVFAAFALRRARGVYLAAFVAVALTWTLQPVAIETGPLAFLLLGLAGRAPFPTSAPASRRFQRVACAVGAVSATWFLVADARFARAVASKDSANIVEAASWLPADAEVLDYAAQAAVGEFLRGESDGSAMVSVSEKKVAIEPDRPRWWIELGAQHLVRGEHAAARTALEHARELQEWNPVLWPLFIELATVTGDEVLRAEAAEHLCAFDPEDPLC